MRAIIAGPNKTPIIVDRPTPTPKPDHHLLHVRAAALNRADLLQLAGKYPPPPGITDILGLEVAGEVVHTNSANTQRLTALLYGGALAEYVLVPHDAVVPLSHAVTQCLSFSQLAAIPEAFIAAHHILFDVANLTNAQSILINAAASGVGTAAIQLARTLPDTTIIATTRTKSKLPTLRSLGAHAVHHVTHDSEDDDELRTVVDNATDGRGVDIVLDCVGAAQFRRLARLLRVGGRWVMYGLLSGARAPDLSLAPIVAKRLTVSGTTLRGQTPEDRARIIAAFGTRFGESFHPKNGVLQPVVHTEFRGIDAIHEAIGVMRENENVGKVVLTIS